MGMKGVALVLAQNAEPNKDGWPRGAWIILGGMNILLLATTLSSSAILAVVSSSKLAQTVVGVER